MRALRGWVSHQRQIIKNWRVVRFVVLANVLVLQIFFLLRDARVERIYRRECKRVGSLGRFSTRRTTLSGPDDQSEARTNDYKLVEARSELPPYNVYLRYCYRFSYYLNWYLLMKHLIICLMRSERFSSLRFLDCFLLGRFTVNGRVIEVASTCACYLIIMQLFWVYLLRGMKTEPHLACVEFLLKSPDEVSYWNQCATDKRRQGQKTNRKRDYIYDDDEWEHLHSSLFELRNPFDMLARGRRYWTFRLRPNRTPKSWRYLARAILRYHLIFIPLILGVIMLFLRMVLPIVLTQRGFELNYKHCIRWLTSANDTSSPFDSGSRLKGLMIELVKPTQFDLMLSVPTGVRHHSSRVSLNNEAVLMPFDELVTFNFYHVIRALLDVMDCLFIYFETALTMNAMGLIAVIMIEDLVCFGSHLNKRLEHRIRALRTRNVLKRDPIYEDLIYRRNHHNDSILGDEFIAPAQMSWHTISSSRSSTAQLHSFVDTQAQIADLFTYMKHYNRYIQYQTVFLVTLWLSYSALVTSWIFLPGNESPKLEWYILHCFATSYLFIFMIRFAEVKKCNCKMHKLIAIAMALDNDCEFSKITWMSLLQFYSPVPLHCFTFITKIELDLMFGLKLVAWLASALIVTASFFNVYNLK